MRRLGRDNSIHVYNGDYTELLQHHSCNVNVMVDPHFECGYPDVGGNNAIYFCDGRRMCDVITVAGAPRWVFSWDCVSTWYSGKKNPLQRVKFALWYGTGDYCQANARIPTGEEPRTIVTSNSRGRYESEVGDTVTISDVFSLPITEHSKHRMHKYEKPLAWITSLIGGCFNNELPVVDLFAGSFVAMDACNYLGREYHGIDIDSCAVEIASTRPYREPIHSASYGKAKNKLPGQLSLFT